MKSKWFFSLQSVFLSICLFAVLSCSFGQASASQDCPECREFNPLLRMISAVAVVAAPVFHSFFAESVELPEEWLMPGNYFRYQLLDEMGRSVESSLLMGGRSSEKYLLLPYELAPSKLDSAWAYQELIKAVWFFRYIDFQTEFLTITQSENDYQDYAGVISKLLIQSDSFQRSVVGLSRLSFDQALVWLRRQQGFWDGMNGLMAYQSVIRENSESFIEGVSLFDDLAGALLTFSSRQSEYYDQLNDLSDNYSALVSSCGGIARLPIPRALKSQYQFQCVESLLKYIKEHENTGFDVLMDTVYSADGLLYNDKQFKGPVFEISGGSLSLSGWQSFRCSASRGFRCLPVGSDAQ